jgi:glycyl-tRNA synthetase beta chain
VSERSLLLELGCEELPSSSLPALGRGLGEALLAQLEQRDLPHGDCRWFATPRRLAVRVDDVADRGADREREALGPPLAQARDEEGNWSRAAQGFAARCGVTPEALGVADTPKGQRLAFRETERGADTRAVLAEIVRDAVAALPIAKRMRWGAGRTEFARPVHWVVLMFGEEDGFGEVLGIDSGRHSRGHRFHAPDALAIESPQRYEAQLGEARVIADFAARRDRIREQVEAAAAALSAQALIDPDLLDEVCSLVEWPVALSGRFDESFLEVPPEALISSMQSHQKYFPVVDSDGRLLPYFITVSNIESRDPAQIIAGNERVIRPRLADAAFFYRQDLRHSLESRVAQLDSVVFQQALGSLGDKARRLEQLAAELAPGLGADREEAARAARLCKADLVSDMVLEFADMQGIAGACYARNDGEGEPVATAIAEHYRPLGAGGELPGTPLAQTVALADRLDTLVGIFGIGQPPSGSKDPFALRRAAIAVLRLSIEGGHDLDLQQLLAAAGNAYPEGLLEDGTQQTVFDYILDRLPSFYEDEGIPVEVLRAVRATGTSRPLDLHRRVLALQAFRQRPEAEALAAANKRVANILGKAENLADALSVSDNLLNEPQEKALNAALGDAGERARAALDSADYTAALEALAALRGPVDAFFDGVMVNAEDPALRANRLALLAQLRAQFLAIADISQLAT